MTNPAPFLVFDAPATLERATVYLHALDGTLKLNGYIDPADTSHGPVSPYLPAAAVEKLAKFAAKAGDGDVITRDGGKVTVTESAWPDEPTEIVAQATGRGVVVWHLAVGWQFTLTA